jgi:hypothetical protein
MVVKIITRSELEENIARAGGAESIGMPEDRFTQFKILVDHNTKLIERLDERTW